MIKNKYIICLLVFLLINNNYSDNSVIINPPSSITKKIITIIVGGGTALCISKVIGDKFHNRAIKKITNSFIKDINSKSKEDITTFQNKLFQNKMSKDNMGNIRPLEMHKTIKILQSKKQ